MANVISARLLGRAYDRARLALIADALACAVAASLPWSTSVSGILIVAWLAAFALSHGIDDVRREVMTPAGGFPVVLWLLAAVGMLWAGVGLAERMAGLGGFHKLLVIPLLLAQFRRSERGIWVLYAFLASCTVLLVASWIAYAIDLDIPNKIRGVVVKDYIAQSSEFLICAFSLAAVAIDFVRRSDRAFAGAAALLAVLFLANIFYVATGRTALVVIALLFALLVLRQFRWKGRIVAILAGVAVCSAVWSSSPFLRERMIISVQDVEKYREQNTVNSSGLRLEFWKKSVKFIASAPIIGHGTGTIPELFRRSAVNATGAAATEATNPHNQYLTVGIQLGIVGMAVLIAMWVAQLALFRGEGLIPWIGLVIVLQSAVSSLFNSHLGDFLHGWLYVFGVGVVGGMALRQKEPPPIGRQ